MASLLLSLSEPRRGQAESCKGSWEMWPLGEGPEKFRGPTC